MKPLEIALPSQDEMLTAVGRGIQAFASVEHGLSMVFASIMEPADRNASFVVLDAARHIETKLRILKAVAAVRLSPAQLAVLNKLLERCNDRRPLRNKLAHWAVSYWPGARTAEEAQNMEVALCPPQSSPKAAAVFWNGESPIFPKDIETFQANCNQLTLDLFSFSSALARR